MKEYSPKHSTILENILVFVQLREQELTYLNDKATISHGSYVAYLQKANIAKNDKIKRR